MPEISTQLVGLVHHYGLLALFLSVMLESLGAPLPGESAILLMATAAGEGNYNIYTVFLAAATASSLGNTMGFLIGRKTSRETIIWLGSKVWLSEAKVVKTERFMQKYGVFMVLISRFLVGLRQLNGIVAGMSGMHWAPFQAANIAGAVLWVGFWSTLAYKFGHNVHILPFLWHHLNYAAALLVLAVLAGLAWRHFRNRTKGQT